MENNLFGIYLILVFCFTLSCTGVSQQQKEMARAQLASELDNCLEKWTKEYLAKHVYNLYTRDAECKNKAETNFFNNVKFPYPEIISLSNSYNLALAERVDSGYLTFKQAGIISRLIRNELIYDAIQRERQITARRSDWRKLIRSINTNYLYNRPITCMRLGNMITCN